MRWMVALVLVAGLVITSFGVSNVNAQSQEELLKMIQQMRQQMESQQKQLQQLEKTLQQRVETTVKKAVEMQPPQSLLGTPPMPPAAVSPAVGLFVNIEPQWISFRGVETRYAVESSKSGPNRPSGKWATVDVEREFAPRYTVGYYLPGGAGIISANFLHANNDDTDRFDGDNVSGDPARAFGPGPDIGTADFATARNRVEVDQFDIQYQYPIQITRRFVLTPEVGLRALKFENRVRSRFFFVDPDEVFFVLDRKSLSTGVGPKVGLTGTWGPFNGFTVSIKGGAGFLLGENEAEHLFCKGEAFNNLGCDNDTFNREKNTGFPFVEGEFTLNYTAGRKTLLRGFSAAAGYRLVNYFDIVTLAQQVAVTGGVSSIFEQNSVLADSIFLRLQYLF